MLMSKFWNRHRCFVGVLLCSCLYCGGHSWCSVVNIFHKITSGIKSWLCVDLCTIIWCWTRIVIGVIWKCIRGPVFRDTVYISCTVNMWYCVLQLHGRLWTNSDWLHLLHLSDSDTGLRAPPSGHLRTTGQCITYDVSTGTSSSQHWRHSN